MNILSIQSWVAYGHVGNASPIPRLRPTPQPTIYKALVVAAMEHSRMKTDSTQREAAAENGAQSDGVSILLDALSPSELVDSVALLRNLGTGAVESLPRADRARARRDLLAWHDTVERHLRLLVTAEIRDRSAPPAFPALPALHLMAYGRVRFALQVAFCDTERGAMLQAWVARPRIAGSRIAGTRGSPTDSLGNALTAKFSEAVEAAIGKAHAAGLAVPGRDSNVSVERRPDGRTASIDDQADWSPKSWEKHT